MSRLFTVLLPITRPPLLLPFAIESVLEQSVTDFELLVICDGAPPETVSCAKAYAARDARVKVFPFPKGARHGEAYRDRVLAEASGCNIAQICDDDLWFPNHLQELMILLSTADFGNLLHVYVRPNHSIEILLGDLSRLEMRRRMIEESYNFFGLSFAGYRKAAYQQLPERWAPAPPDIWTDLFMWRKFLSLDNAKFATRAAITALHFATHEREHATLEERQNESREFLARIRNTVARNDIVEMAWHSLLDRALEAEATAAALTGEQAGLKTTAATLKANQARLKTKLDQTRRRLKAKENKVNAMRSSRSWRLTAPLRTLSTKLALRTN